MHYGFFFFISLGEVIPINESTLMEGEHYEAQMEKLKAT